MKLKTSELTGLALDWAVARCEGRVLTYHAISTRNGDRKYAAADADFCTEYSPSTNWAQGGPIIEREEIYVNPTGCAMGWKAFSWVDAAQNFAPEHFGPTPLIAAMRCFVASKLGDEVEVPDELLQFINRGHIHKDGAPLKT
jgi:hypothetical protein